MKVNQDHHDFTMKTAEHMQSLIGMRLSIVNEATQQSALAAMGGRVEPLSRRETPKSTKKLADSPSSVRHITAWNH